MTLRVLILGCVALFPALAHAQDGSARMFDRFWKICSAAVDEKPDLEKTFTSLGMKGLEGPLAVMTVGHQTSRSLTTENSQQTIAIVTTKYADAREIECISIVSAPTPKTDLESAINPLSLDGSFLPIPDRTMGRWKRRGLPFVLVTATSMPSSTVLTMRRIDTQ